MPISPTLVKSRRTSSSAETTRLDIGRWVEAALDLLASFGIDAVRIEPLAKQLSVTKGSFYWHFKDRPALLSAILETWRRRATGGVIERLEKSDEPAIARFHRLIILPFAGMRSSRGAQLEMAIRLWARRDPIAQSAVSEIDEQRLRYIKSLLVAMGVDQRDTSTMSFMFYSCVLGEAMVVSDKPTDLTTLLDLFDNLVATSARRRNDADRD